METIGKLTLRERLAVKPLWSEIFFEDSDLFTDYYFKEKMPENIGYGLKKDGRLAAMLFLTPYTGRIRLPGREDRFLDVPLHYIVGVGTKREYRHRGYMGALLRHALSKLHAAGAPFTFLMPADPAIYTPYQFRYIYVRPKYRVTEEGRRRAQPMKSGEEAALAAFAERFLEERYQFFLKRDASYYRRQKKESLAQNGDVYLWKEDGEIAGFYLYARENGKTEIQEAAGERQTAEGMLEISEKKEPIIMARIADAAAMLSLLRLREEAPDTSVSIAVAVKDPLIAQNNATFLWTVGKKESTIALLEKTEDAQVCVAIEALTEFVFGRKSAAACFDCISEKNGNICGGIYAKLSEVAVLSEICLNEIV
ncbi:MAG: GNAT family N-acetyltransferase [Lachnospiraceae bacterium]|nr:GNAT family N-acetyltransferase [Lachnospiraceae bacterium]